MKKVLNKYSVYRNGQCWLTDIANYDGVIDVINYMLESLQFTEEDIENTITGAYLASNGNPDDILSYTKFKRAYWFKENRFQIIVKAIQTNEVVEIDRFDEIDNELLKPIKAFNGKSLRLNAIEPPSKFKLGAFHDPDTWFALSVFRNKGWSTLGKGKKERGSGDALAIADKLKQMPDYAEWSTKLQTSDIIRKLLNEGVSACEVRRRLKPQFKGRQSELKGLIYQLNS